MTAVEAPAQRLVIFGATGDLAKRKLVPALYTLASDGSLPAGFSEVGAGWAEVSDEQFRASMREGISKYSRIPADQCRFSTHSSKASTT
jgi:glucose-6-phosphate 1-dehydrogenase